MGSVGVGAVRAHMHGRGAEPTYRLQEVLLGVMSKFMPSYERQVWIDGEVNLGAQGVPDPSDAQVADFPDAVDGRDCAARLLDESGIHGIQ